jgi:hypothetical protein
MTLALWYYVVEYKPRTRLLSAEEPQATKDLRSSLKLQLRGFFASLRMTDRKRFSAACLTPTFANHGKRFRLQISTY